MAEETTKGLVVKKLNNLPDYPSEQNIEHNGIIYFKEDSYKDSSVLEYAKLGSRFAKASKNQKGKDRGTPDYMVVKRDSDTIIVIECKQNKKYHSRFDNVEDYILNGYGNPSETEDYAIDGALWYAEFLKDSYDVIVIAASGTSDADSRITSFVYPKHGEKLDVKLIEDGTLIDSLASINQSIRERY